MNAALKHMTPDAFLDWCQDQEGRWELYHGIPIEMMTGASNAHDDLVINVIAALKERLRGKPCRPRTADVASRMQGGNIRRPDISVDCGPRDPRSLETTAPTVFIEVLSPSTRSFDLLRKPEEYKRVPSLRNILLIDPDMARVWVWSRSDDQTPWSDHDAVGVDAVIALPAVGVDLPLAVIYEGVTFED
jgi:Uma2 family endonuclease